MAKENGSHRKRTDNLMPPWKKGQSGNPTGNPPGIKTAPARTFTEICRQYLSESIAPGDDRTRAEVLATAMYAKSLKGDTRAASVILDRVDPALKKIEVTGVVADQGNAMLDRLMHAQQLPVQQYATSFVVPVNRTNGQANGNGHNAAAN